ncbi:MAG: substrate-binding domain-containing protein, partial [Clostridia bacterium]|nr:substrate-binding domain-containing protein [Clostridia bacterium]
MKKLLTILLSMLLLVTGAVGLTACGGEKNITVVARTQGSGTREAFDKVVTDGKGNYLEMKINGDKHFFTTDKAVVQEKTGTVMSKVASDKNAIGYISLGSVNDTIKVIKVNGVAPSAETVLDGSYAIQRPFVIMTSSEVQLTDLAADFLLYLKSENSKQHADEAGCIYLSDPSMRANEGATAIPVVEYEVKSSLPSGGKIRISGS